SPRPTPTSSSTTAARRRARSTRSSRPRGAPCAISSASSCGTKSSPWGSSTDMSDLVIRGGRRLEGFVAVGGNKNAALPLLAACLLTPETCELRNVPLIRDVTVMLELLRSLGAEVEGEGTSTIRVTCRHIRSSEPDPALVGRLRGSVLLLGSLVGRTGAARLASPGGDFPARRTITTHLRALGAMGARISE